MSQLNGQDKEVPCQTLVRKNQCGQAVRFSKYFLDANELRVLSETILYPNGSFTLHLYGKSGEIKDVIKYDENGDRLPLTTINLISH